MFHNRFAALAMLVLTAAGPALAQTTRPAGAGAAVQYAPEKLAGVVHAEVKALAKDVLAAFAKDPEFKALDANVMAALMKFAEKIESVDICIPDAGDAPSLPVFVVRGALTPADINAVLRALELADEDVLRKKEGARGRYELGLSDKLPFEYVLGGESPDLPAGISLIGPGTAFDANMLSKAGIGRLGKGDYKALQPLLAAADKSAPIWFAILGEKLSKESDAPKTAYGSAFLLGGGISKVVLEFKDANAAEQGMKEVTTSAGSDDFLPQLLNSLFQPTRDGVTLTFTARSKDSLAPAIVSLLAESRKVARRTASMVNLRSIGADVFVWSADHDDKLPQDLLDMVKAGAFTAQKLVNPTSGREVKVDAKGLPVGAFESDYVLVRYPMPTNKIRGGDKLVLAYERPQNYKDQKTPGTIVLFVDGHCEWLKADDFQAKLKATEEWLAGQK